MRPSRLADAWHFVAIAGALALIAVLGARPIVHDDVFFHLRTGEMVAHTGVVPTSDSFTHTLPGTPWTTHEWGFGLLLYGAYRLGGLPALAGLMPLVLVGIFLAVYLQMRRVVAPERLALLTPLLLLGVGAAEASCFVLRAALFTTLGFALLVHLLQRLHAGGGARVVAGIALLFLVWANMHAGVMFGLAILGLHAIQPVLDAWRSTTAGVKDRWAAVWRGRSRDRVLLFIACAAITLVNPNGLDLWTFPFRLNRLLYASGLRYDMGIFGAPLPGRHPMFFALVALSLAACLPVGPLWRARRDATWPTFAHALGTACLLTMALRSNRFIFDFVVFALPWCAMAWGGRMGAAGASGVATPGRLPRAWVEFAGVVAVLGTTLVMRPALPERALADRVPVRLAEFMAREHIAGRMFNPESFGGYLGWRLRQPVYWDGRNDIFGPVAMEFARMSDLGDLVRRHGLDALALDARYDEKFHAYLIEHRAEWALVYWDDVSALYLKREPKFLAILERWEYELLRPFRVPLDSEIVRVAADPALHKEMQAELARALAQGGDTYIVWYLRGRLAQEAGDHAGAYAALQRALRLQARPDVVYHLARAARDLGKDDEARMLFQRYMSRVPR